MHIKKRSHTCDYKRVVECNYKENSSAYRSVSMEIMLYKEELRKCLLIKGGTILMYINTLYSDWMYCHSSEKKMSSCHHVLCLLKYFAVKLI